MSKSGTLLEVIIKEGKNWLGQQCVVNELFVEVEINQQKHSSCLAPIDLGKIEWNFYGGFSEINLSKNRAQRQMKICFKTKHKEVIAHCTLSLTDLLKKQLVIDSWQTVVWEAPIKGKQSKTTLPPSFSLKLVYYESGLGKELDPSSHEDLLRALLFNKSNPEPSLPAYSPVNSAPIAPTTNDSNPNLDAAQAKMAEIRSQSKQVTERCMDLLDTTVQTVGTIHLGMAAQDQKLKDMLRDLTVIRSAAEFCERKIGSMSSIIQAIRNHFKKGKMRNSLFGYTPAMLKFTRKNRENDPDRKKHKPTFKEQEREHVLKQVKKQMELEKIKKMEIAPEAFENHNKEEEQENPYLQGDEVEKDVEHIAVVIHKLKQRAVEFGEKIGEHEQIRAEIEDLTNSAFYGIDKNNVDALGV